MNQLPQVFITDLILEPLDCERAVLAAIEHRDGDTAAQAMRHHIRCAGEDMKLIRPVRPSGQR